MQTEYVVLLTMFITLMLLIVQRSERKYRRVVFLLFLFTGGILLRNFVVYREIESEGWLALVLSLVLNFFFWLFIGRYNPVGSSDNNIQVLGMDD
jgi:ATP adenylyltransferase/5',5'''-P-1,P-4-tetraphosphate phosphorylase II